MDIVSMALSSVQPNSELLGLATVAQQNKDAHHTAEGGIGALSEHTSVDTDVGLGLGPKTCSPTIIDGSVVNSSISQNCAPVILMMGQDELRPSTETAILTTEEGELSVRNGEPPQNGKTSNAKAILKVVQRTIPELTTTKPTTISSTRSGNLINSIPVELSSSTSAASSILGSIASMIDPNAANISNTSIVPTNVNTTNSTLTNTTVSRTIITSNANNVANVVNPQIDTPAPLTILKEPRVPLTIPLQTKSAATITIKTPPGTSLTGPSGSMSGPLLQTILNNAEVQALMKRNPGQQITIVQIPDESLGYGNWGVNSSIKSAVNEAKKITPTNNVIDNEAKKIISTNNTKIIHTPSAFGRKRKKLEPEPEEKAKTQKVTRPVKKITRSGRISRPPLYRIRDYKTILPTEEVESGSSDEDYEDYVDQTEKETLLFSDKPKNFKCTNCDKSYIGQASLDRHFRQNPTHGTPVGPSPEKKTAENIESNEQTADGKDSEKPEQQTSPEPGDLNTSETAHSPLASRLHNTSIRGRGRGMRKRGRGRGRIPVYGNHSEKPYSPAASSVTWSNTERLPLDKRKEKAKELMDTFVDEDFLDVILPRLPHVVTPWEFLLMKTEAEETRTPNFADVYNQYLSLLKEVKKVAQGCLTRAPDEDIEVESSNGDSSSPSLKLKITDIAAANSLGLSTGCYDVKESLIPVSRQPSSVAPVRTPPQKKDIVVVEKEPVVTLSQPPKKVKVEESQNERKKEIPVPITKSMPSLTPLRNRPLNLKSVVTPGPIAEHPIPPGRPLPELKPIPNDKNKESSESVTIPVAQVSQSTITPSTAILTGRLTSIPELTPMTEAMPLQESGQLMESLSPGENGGLAVKNTGSSELAVDVEDQVPLLQTVDGDVGGLQQLVVPEVIHDVLPEVDDTSPIDIMPVGSTLMQLQDGTFLVQRPDGTTMQIQAPEGMTIETIQELLSVDGAMQFSDADTSEMALAETEDVVMVPGLDVNPADLSSEVAAT